MEPEEKKLLEKTYRLVDKNNEMLHRIRRSQNRRSFFNILRWVIIIGISFGIFYFLQPYVDAMKEFIENTKSFVDDTGSTINQIKDFLPN
jgi:hypothetical protein